ncbi:MAG: hypothetical protein ACXAB8_15310 [Promethearchaeota archaeon]
MGMLIEVLSILRLEKRKIIVKGRDWEQKFPYDQYINELCKVCQIKSPSATEETCVGECQEIESIHDEFADVAEYETKSTEEKMSRVLLQPVFCRSKFTCMVWENYSVTRYNCISSDPSIPLGRAMCCVWCVFIGMSGWH